MCGAPSDEQVTQYWSIMCALKARNPDCIVFADECCSDRRSHRRNKGRAPPGERVPLNGSLFPRGVRIASIGARFSLYMLTKISDLVAINNRGILAERSQIGGTLSGNSINSFLLDELVSIVTTDVVI